MSETIHIGTDPVGTDPEKNEIARENMESASGTAIGAIPESSGVEESG